jgi:hypothetical protein
MVVSGELLLCKIKKYMNSIFLRNLYFLRSKRKNNNNTKKRIALRKDRIYYLLASHPSFIRGFYQKYYYHFKDI